MKGEEWPLCPVGANGYTSPDPGVRLGAYSYGLKGAVVRFDRLSRVPAPRLHTDS